MEQENENTNRDTEHPEPLEQLKGQEKDQLPAGRREEKKRANRAAILAAGRQVYIEIGYDAATVRDIVRASGLSPGTFYNYFQDKEAVFLDILRDVLLEVRAELKKARSGPKTARKFLTDAFGAYFAVFAQDKEILKIISRNQSALRNAVFGGDLLGGLVAELKTDLARGIDARLIPEGPIHLLAWSMVGAGFEMLARMAQEPDLGPEEVTTFITDLFLGGMERLGKKSLKAAKKEQKEQNV